MLNIPEIAAYLFTCTIAAATPGPGTLSVITYSTYLGWRKTLPIIFGIQVGMLAVALLALSGIAAILAASPVIFKTIQYVGAIYIAYLGLLSFKYAHTNLAVQLVERNNGGWRHFWHGALLTFTSPKTLLFFTSFFPGYLDPEKPVVAQMGSLLVLLLACTFLVHFSYAFLMKHLGNRLLEHSTAFNLVVGVIFVGMAGYMALQV
ncbi:LysE family translocator [Chitinivorax sp. B]|uniref:LysE family translocator n=1 Tax=Chitinivorax sp. B TaxID=2502235 RepID=UPI0010F9D048|nr:LysE family translocator [Chitinivorax sp. B]